MRFAYVGKTKTEPFPKGVGTCPACGAKTVAKWGSQKIWHWAHGARHSCDPWWENETPWHRAWKSYWAIEHQEVVHTDALTGERHIADVKNGSGLVLEFQNSAMDDVERGSRESFYRNMIWVVNGLPFLKNIEFGAKLPNPDLPGSMDLGIYPPLGVRPEFLYYRRSENDPGSTLVLLHNSDDIREFVVNSYVGHHLFTWKHSRDVWYRSAVPVYLDFGGEVMWQFVKFNDRSPFCLKSTMKAEFIRSNGGSC